MAIYALIAHYALLKGREFDPEQIECMVTAFEKALSLLALKCRDDPATRLIAEAIIKTAQTGMRDPEQICQRAIAELSRPVLIFAYNRGGGFG